ncbi:inosine/xanthosine triphosphatase [Halosegnis marinus]|uniref:inosine/xanthosine triphosphatase n=1 Tax=Halosegnis marinus TaxID=3034023 RepID=A0ABD5ZQY8_9EURY|nr:inosine/xanthosine triphosphatase [Halosegnis sp. DT85]
MHVAVGSGNPVKAAAVEAALPDAAVEAVPVESGVAEQPYGLAETIAGAETRAERALPGYDLAVGIEGGVARLPDTEGLWLVMWAAATDGERWGRGSGPSLRLPESIAARVAAGEELGPVMDDVLGEEHVARKQGAAGALTGGVIDRQGALEGAVAGALGPFLTDRY